MALTTLPAGNLNRWAALTRTIASAWFGENITGTAKAPDVLNNEWITSVNAAGTGLVNLIKANANDQVIMGGSGSTGTLILDLSASRTLSTNAIVNLAGVGGILAADSDPIFERTNGATDKSLRVSWASASVKELQLPSVPWPVNLDPASPVIVNILAKMKAASVDVPVIAVSAFEGVGGSNLGGNTAALSTTLAVVTSSLTVTGYPSMLSVSLTPAAHATSSNDVYVYAVWLTYSKK